MCVVRHVCTCVVLTLAKVCAVKVCLCSSHRCAGVAVKAAIDEILYNAGTLTGLERKVLHSILYCVYLQKV